MSTRLKEVIKKWVLPRGYIEAAGLAKQYFATRGVKYDSSFLQKSQELKGRHIGQRCFVLGAGSSIREQNLKKLQGEFVISVSNSYVHEDFYLLRPQYHVLPHLLYGHGNLHEKEKFVLWLKEMHEKIFDADLIMHIGDKAMIDEYQLFKGRNIYWNDYIGWDQTLSPEIDLARVPAIWSVSELAITVALYLGFEKIYLLGFDHDWFNGLFTYFYDHKTQHVMQPDEKKLHYVDSEFQMRRHADIFKKYKHLQSIKQNIFNANANPRHYLDVFPKVNFDDLFTQSGGDNDR